ncbi:uncharacterized protein LOC124352771 isoform X1 [Homalodisca vitripennis]|uniref:uncharacterized protein LOC124352771 isoform X1 n=1 Tax=Homalodisca vitripennis TaxID=197043 RepID=UPI001EEA402C|nr:uncharacterized protein LOC124352771 isoform X1 [Homalodisca vitripennis]
MLYISATLLRLLLLTIPCHAHILYADEVSETRNELGLYRNLEEVLNVFKRDESNISKEILESFQQKCLYMEDPVLPMGKRKPFIVVEGNQKSSKHSIALKLANLLDGRYITRLAPCLRRFSSKLLGSSPLMQPFHFLSLYASAFEARVQMTLNRAVVISGYWTEQLSSAISRSFQAGALPPVSADFFRYPDDLMQPDLHVFLSFSEALYTTTPAQPVYYKIDNVRRQFSLKKRKLELYRHLQSELPILIHELQRVSNHVTARQLVEQIRANLSGTRDVHQGRSIDY